MLSINNYSMHPVPAEAPPAFETLSTEEKISTLAKKIKGLKNSVRRIGSNTAGFDKKYAKVSELLTKLNNNADAGISRRSALKLERQINKLYNSSATIKLRGFALLEFANGERKMKDYVENILACAGKNNK